MKKILLITVILLIGNNLSAQLAGQVASNMAPGGSQNVAAAAAIGALLGPVSQASQKRNKFDLKNFQGSPYTSDTFTPTQLFYNNEKVGSIYYRYNALNDEIEIKKTTNEEENYQALARDKNISITIDNHPLSFKTFITSKNNTENGYLSLIIDGEVYDLYKRVHVKFTEGQRAQNSFVAAIPNRFSHFEEYYFQIKGINRIDEIQLKNKKLLKLLNEPTKTKVKNYLKENDMNINKESDLLSVFKFLNS